MAQHFKAVAAEIWAAKIIWAVVDLVADLVVETWAAVDFRAAVDSVDFRAAVDSVDFRAAVKPLVMAIMACKTL